MATNEVTETSEVEIDCPLEGRRILLSFGKVHRTGKHDG